GVDLCAWRGLDDRGDGLAPAFIRQPDGDRVPHRRVRLEHLFDLLRVHLLPARVDADRPAAQHPQRPVLLDDGVVARNRVALAVDGEEGAGGLLRVLVVPDWLATADRQLPLHARLGYSAAVLVDQDGVVAQAELGGLGRALAGRHRLAHAEGL